MHIHKFLIILMLLIFSFLAGCISEQAPPPESIPGPSIIEIEDIASSGSVFTVSDATGREVEIPKNISHILCSGPGCLRYLAYLQASEITLTNNPEERYVTRLAWLSYLVANPGLRDLPSIQAPLYPAQIQSLSPKPDLIVLMNSSGPYSPDDLSRMTNTPILVLKEGDLINAREDMNYSIRVLGLITGKGERASDVIRFFDKIIDNLKSRVSTIPEFQHKVAYIAGFSTGFSTGADSTASHYHPFDLIKVENAAEQTINGNNEVIHFSSEQIRKMNPDALFIDLSTLEKKETAMDDLERNQDFSKIGAIKNGDVYGVLPTRMYGESHEVVLMNAYGIGKVLYPNKFMDVDPKTMADYIFIYLYGEPIFEEVNKEFGNLAFSRIPVFM